MTMGSDGSIRVPLHIDVSAVSDDLAQIDKEVQRLEQRMVAAFNRGGLVRRGRAQRASSIEDVGSQRGAWTPEVRALERQLDARLKQIERAAQRGETRSPLTPVQQARHEAQQRLSAAARPTEITAKQKFFDDMVTSLRRGAPNVVGMAAGQSGIPGASRLAHTLMGLAGDNPLLAGLLGGGAALGGGALAVASAQANFQRQQASLASSLVGGPAFGTTRTLEGLAVMAAGQGLDTSNEESGALAQTLARSGMSRSQLLGNLSNVLMLAKPSGIASGDISPLAGALSTAGGMSAQQINASFQDLSTLAGSGLNGSLQQLLQGMKALSSGAVGAARDIYSLAAIQRAVGPSSGIVAGALMQGVMGATGGQALQAAGILGMTPQAFMAAQSSPGGMAQIYDRIAAFARRLPPGAAGTLVAEQVLGDNKLLNPQGLSPTTFAGLIQGMRTAPPGQASAWAQQYLKQAQHQRVSQAASYAQAAKGADVVTGPIARATIAVQNATIQLVNQPHPQPAPSSAAPGFGAPIPQMFPIATGSADTSGGPSVRHDVNIKVSVHDQHGKELTRKVDHTRVVTGGKHHGHPPPGHPQVRP